MQPLDNSPVPLSIHHAFVIHVRDGMQVETGQITGRIEHIVSGQVAHFASLRELLEFIGRQLHQGGDASA